MVHGNRVSPPRKKQICNKSDKLILWKKIVRKSIHQLVINFKYLNEE